MYKTVSISNQTYQLLQSIANRLDKPKAQVIDDLVRKQDEEMSEEEKKKLDSYNTFVASLAKRIKLPKGTEIKSEDLDKDFAVLGDQEF